MAHWPNILGKGDGDAYEYIFIIAFVVISLVSGLLKRAKRTYDERRGEQAERQHEQELRRRRAAESGQAAGMEQQDMEQETVTAYRRPAPPPTPVIRQPVPVRMPRRTPPPPPVESEEPVPGLRAPGQLGHELGTGVEHEVETREATREAQDATRHQRLKEFQPHVAPSAAQQHEQSARIVVDLRLRSQALAAVVFNEILSPPKALRSGPEPWER